MSVICAIQDLWTIVNLHSFCSIALEVEGRICEVYQYKYTMTKSIAEKYC